MIKTFADSFGFGEVRELVGGISEGKRRSSGSIKSKKISQIIVKGAIAQELENAWRADPITFRSINQNVQMIMSAGYTIKTDPVDQEDFDNFWDGLGEIGEDYTGDELLEFIFWSQMVSGFAWIENLFDAKTDKRIVDLTRLDFKQMDYARDAQGDIVLDENQKPVGYVQQVASLGFVNEGHGDEVPPEFKDKVDLSKGGIFLLLKRIALFKLYTGASGFDALGLIQPAYKSILWKLNIEEAQTSSIHARGFNPLIDYVGNEKIPPTPQRLEQALETMKKMKHDRYFALPWYHNVKPVEVKQSDIIDQILKHLRENQSAAFGIPMAFATGSGEATNRATLNNQQKMLEFTLNDIVTKTISSLQKFIFKPLAKQRKYKAVPKIMWNRIGTEDWDEKSTRLQRNVELNILSPAEVRPMIIKMESLSIDENAAPPTQEKKTGVDKDESE